MAKKGFAIVYFTQYHTTEVVFYQNPSLAHAYLNLLLTKGLSGYMFPDMEMD